MKTKTALLFSIIFLLLTVAAYPQKGINGLLQAEKGFARFTASHNIREGFLSYMDSTGIIFKQGQVLVAREFYQTQKASPAKLNWQPAFAVISASGDMGATTGPYQFRPSPKTDTTVLYGNFSSVWQMNKKGQWKNLADLGTVYPDKQGVLKQIKKILPDTVKKITTHYAEVLAHDRILNIAVQNKNRELLFSYISNDSWLNIDGQAEMAGKAAVIGQLLKIPDHLQLNQQNGGISSAKDFVYIYGTVILAGKKENYLRIWIYRNQQWQVILQTIKW